MGAEEELADVDRRESAGDALEHHVQPMALGQHRVDERASLMSMRRPLDLSIRSTSSLTMRRVEAQVGQLVATAAGDEDPARVIDPDLLDLGVVEEGLERPEAGDPGDELADHRAVVGDRSHRTGQAQLVVAADDVLGDAAYDEGLALRVDAFAADLLAHLGVEAEHQVVVGVRPRQRLKSVHRHGRAPRSRERAPSRYPALSACKTGVR